MDWTRTGGSCSSCQAGELGITFWDTANGHGGGTWEKSVGCAVNAYGRREGTVLATKVHNKMHDGPGGSGLSRKAISNSSTPRCEGGGPTTSNGAGLLQRLRLLDPAGDLRLRQTDHVAVSFGDHLRQ